MAAADVAVVTAAVSPEEVEVVLVVDLAADAEHLAAGEGSEVDAVDPVASREVAVAASRGVAVAAAVSVVGADGEVVGSAEVDGKENLRLCTFFLGHGVLLGFWTGLKSGVQGVKCTLWFCGRICMGHIPFSVLKKNDMANCDHGLELTR